MTTGKTHILHPSELTRHILERLVVPALMILCMFLFGTVGFQIIGGGKWGLFDCAYMTSLTLTTVGYGEVLNDMTDGARLFAMVLMWSGMGVILYAVSAITGFVVEQNLSRLLRERKMQKRIAALKNHYVVCGAGRTGANIVRELVNSRRPCVVLELKPERIERLRNQFENLFIIQGDATEEEVLQHAGIEKAAGVLAALGDDSHNLLITVQTRFSNPDIKIVARCQEKNLVEKFFRAGANYVVNPAAIGGMRMASEMVRPHVVSFLDRMLRGKDNTIRVEEVTVCEGSPWTGRSMGDLKIHDKTGLMPIAVKSPEEEEFTYNPSQNTVLTTGSVVIVIGSAEQVQTLRQYCSEHTTLQRVAEKLMEE